MNEKAVFGLIPGFVLIVLAIQSGILWWAIPAGIVSAATVFYFSRNLQATAIAGATVVAGISWIGIADLLSPGWYNTLL